MSICRIHRVDINTQFFSRWLLIHHIVYTVYSRCHVRRMTAAGMVSLLLQRSCQLWVLQMRRGVRRVDLSAAGGGMNWAAYDWLAGICSCCAAVMTIAAGGGSYWTYAGRRLHLDEIININLNKQRDRLNNTNQLLFRYVFSYMLFTMNSPAYRSPTLNIYSLSTEGCIIGDPTLNPSFDFAELPGELH